jgi:hypothetical protein
MNLNWVDFCLGILGVSPFVFGIMFLRGLELQRRDDERLAREFDEEMRKTNPKWGKR